MVSESRVKVKFFFWWIHCSPFSFSCLHRRCRHLGHCRRHHRSGPRHHHHKRLIQAITVPLESWQSEQRRSCSGRFCSSHRCRRAWRCVRRLFRQRLPSLWSSSCKRSGSVLIIFIGVFWIFTFFLFLSPLLLLPRLPLSLLQLLWLSKLLLCHHLPCILLHLIPQVHLLFLMNFLNGMRIVRTLIPLHLLHIQVSLLLGSPILILLILGF